jgi:dienelactone hydrolase
VLPAQKLAQTHPGAIGAVLYHGAVPPSAFGAGWPDGVGLQFHFCEHDPWAEEDLEVARSLAAETGGELFVYPGSGHLVADSSFSDHDPDVAAQILDRTLAFLDARR